MRRYHRDPLGMNSNARESHMCTLEPSFFMQKCISLRSVIQMEECYRTKLHLFFFNYHFETISLEISDFSLNSDSTPCVYIENIQTFGKSSTDKHARMVNIKKRGCFLVTFQAMLWEESPTLWPEVWFQGKCLVRGCHGSLLL